MSPQQAGEGQCRWSHSCLARPSWGNEQVPANECSRGAGGVVGVGGLGGVRLLSVRERERTRSPRS